ncbi:MAG: aminopeptidase N [Pseudomonadota bacterium]
MKDAAAPAPQPTLLADYTPYPFAIDDVSLSFRLSPSATRVISRIAFRPNPEAKGPAPLRLDGEGLKLIWARIDGQEVSPEISATGLSVDAPEGAFVWEAEVEIDPSSNTALEGLYISNEMYCTQCEAEGFRKITYYPDRPDVMAPFSVDIHADVPMVRLSNGNPIDDGYYTSTWHDPHPKPAYLFALVAGNLSAHTDHFTTASGRRVELHIWVRSGDRDKCAYAMDALKRSMRWDEEVYGREYDLDVFNIVAVDDLNMGAMENKGLNIFNSKYVLASPETATDRDYDLIEGIIAHEYFHNWTGNRITCRDWFQLCLKEGLTVYRDQQFSGDMRSAPVKRIEDVLQLRARQFREDAGPLAHNVRPESYIEINNFYTATVYEKGAELIGMLRAIVGEDGWRAGCDLYFDRHDGQACTIEDWLAAFEDASGTDLSQFKRWYAQAGTPRLSIDVVAEGNGWTATARQNCAPTPGQPEKSPLPIPIKLALFAPDGTPLPAPGDTTTTEWTHLMTGPEEVIARGDTLFDGRPPILSALRGFSAPVILELAQSKADRLTLMAHDSDPFNRWEAGRSLAKEALVAMIVEGSEADPDWLTGLGAVLADDSLDPDFRALVLALPSEDDLAQTLYAAAHVPDPAAIHAATRRAAQAIAEAHEGVLARAYDAMAVPGLYSPDAGSAGRRSLRLAALRYLSHLDGGDRARALFDQRPNMTEELGAFGNLLRQGDGTAAAEFEARWRHDRLVMDKWFMLQVSEATPENAVATAETLTRHADFDWSNPNRIRSVIGGLIAGNPAGFHASDGSGYAFLADWLIRLDAKNPQTAARMSTAFETWRRYDADRQGLMLEALGRIAARPGLSRDLGEMVQRMRAG